MAAFTALVGSACLVVNSFTAFRIAQATWATGGTRLLEVRGLQAMWWFAFSGYLVVTAAALALEEFALPWIALAFVGACLFALACWALTGAIALATGISRKSLLYSAFVISVASLLAILAANRNKSWPLSFAQVETAGPVAMFLSATLAYLALASETDDVIARRRIRVTGAGLVGLAVTVGLLHPSMSSPWMAIAIPIVLLSTRAIHVGQRKLRRPPDDQAERGLFTLF